MRCYYEVDSSCESAISPPQRNVIQHEVWEGVMIATVRYPADPTKTLDVGVDNRDATETELHAWTGTTVVVDPWELLANLIDNLPEEVRERSNAESRLESLREDVLTLINEV